MNPIAGDLKDPLDPLIEIKVRYVDKNIDWYRVRTTWPRLIFRMVGMSVIVLSLSIPFLLLFQDTVWKGLLPLASFMLASLTALNSFFGWQRTWEKRITIRLTLEGLEALWQTEIAAAKREADPLTSFDLALKATRQLIDKTQSLTVGETAAFFSNVRFPDVPAETRPTKPPAA